MKKLISILFAILYLASTTGAQVHMHYCMGELVELSLGESKAKTCGNCGMNKKDAKNKGCCKDEYKKVKVEKAHKVFQTSVLELQAPVLLYLPSFYPFHASTRFSCDSEKRPVANAPPLWRNTPIFKRNCAFLI